MEPADVRPGRRDQLDDECINPSRFAREHVRNCPHFSVLVPLNIVEMF